MQFLLFFSTLPAIIATPALPRPSATRMPSLCSYNRVADRVLSDVTCTRKKSCPMHMAHPALKMGRGPLVVPNCRTPWVRACGSSAANVGCQCQAIILVRSAVVAPKRQATEDAESTTRDGHRRCTESRVRKLRSDVGGAQVRRVRWEGSEGRVVT